MVTARCWIGLLLYLAIAGQAAVGQANPFEGLSNGIWIPATDSTKVQASGDWQSAAFRYAATEHLLTDEEGAVLKIEFSGTGLVLRLGGHAVPSYGKPNLGILEVRIDGSIRPPLHLHSTPREIALDRDLGPGKHWVQLRHIQSAAGTGCRIEGVYALESPSGELAFEVNGEEDAYLVDLRAVLMHQGKVVRNTLVRNWLNGRCRLAGLPVGSDYILHLKAAGWQPHTEVGIEIPADGQTTLAPVHLKRQQRTRGLGVRYPSLGAPVVQRPGDQFDARLIIVQHRLEALRLVRQVGPATISRQVAVEEDTSAAFYYDRQFRATIPADTPPGLYDLVGTIRLKQGRVFTVSSPRSVYVLGAFPENPVFMTFGHLDTWGQYQAEYLQELASIANIVAADMVLVSNAVNPAYISGALCDVDVPYVVTFGNHQFVGHEHWYGQPVGVVDFGKALTVLNFGLYWHDDLSKARALLAARKDTGIKVINGFEHNAPLQAFLDRYKVAMIHDGHGPGQKIMELGATPTLRVGKSNSESFRLVRFQSAKVVSATYMGSAVDPIPFKRGQATPIRIEYSPANDGHNDTVTATITNDLEEDFQNCKVVLVMPKALEYTANNGQLEHVIRSDDGAFAVVTVRFDLSAQATRVVSVASR